MQGRKTGGRTRGIPNKKTAEIKLLAQEYTERALAVLADIMENGEHEAARVSAAKELIDRGHGKAAQPVDVNGNITITPKLIITTNA